MKEELAMAIPHAKPGEVVDVRPLGSALASAQTRTVVRAEQVEVIRLVVPAGKEIEEHKAKGEIIVQCLEGKVAFTAFGKTQNLEAGRLLYLPTGEPHSVKGIEDASLLLTVLLPKH
jgi:quercetin dioxygenase-like cupin family protein